MTEFVSLQINERRRRPIGLQPRAKAVGVVFLVTGWLGFSALMRWR